MLHKSFGVLSLWIVYLSLGATVQLLCLSCDSLAHLAHQKLPDPQGELIRDVPSSAISAANTEVKPMQIEQQPTTKLKSHSRDFQTLWRTEFPVFPEADLPNSA